MAPVTQLGPDSRQGLFTASLWAYRTRIRVPLKTWEFGVIWGPRLANRPTMSDRGGKQCGSQSDPPASGRGVPLLERKLIRAGRI